MANTIKIGDVEEAARLILLDTYADAYRFEPKEIYAAIASAVERLRVEQPVSRYVNGLGPVAVEFDYSIPASPATTTWRAYEINMERKWQEAIVYYVVHKMYLKDDPDTTNANLAARYLELYTAARGG